MASLDDIFDALVGCHDILLLVGGNIPVDWDVILYINSNKQHSLKNPIFTLFFLTENLARLSQKLVTGCFLHTDIKRFCWIFTIGPDRIWFCFILVSDFFSTIIPRIWSMI